MTGGGFFCNNVRGISYNIIKTMNKIFEINENALLSATHLVTTKRGLIEAQDLKKGDIVIGIKGVSKITKIIECAKRPDAPIIGNENGKS